MTRWTENRFAIVGKALLIAVALVALKLLLIQLGLQRPFTMPLVTALLGGVIFTLAILLSGVFADFKESERLVSDLSSSLRRLHAELALLATGERLAAMRAELSAIATVFTEDLREGQNVRTSAILQRMDRLDALLLEASRSGVASSQLRTAQVSLTTITRVMDRLEVIVETTFMRAGYVFVMCTATLGLAVLTLAEFDPWLQGVALHGLTAFILVGLLILIHDLDNPFDGAVHTSIEQLEKVEAWLRKAS